VRVLSAAEVRAALPMSACVAAARRALAADAVVPQRPVLHLPRGDVLFMPGRLAGVAVGVKVVGVFAGNPARGLPGTPGVMLLVDEETGVPEALLDGTSLTSLRTGAATGVAADRLARPDAAVLAVLGAGGIAADQIAGVRAVRPIREVRLWNRTPAKAATLAAQLTGVRARAFATAAEAVAGADVVVCCTAATAPVGWGPGVAPGPHVSAVGAYTADMAEVDAACVTRAAVVAADNVAEAARTGDLAGRVDPARILPVAAAGPRPAGADLTLFKSVGTAALDLACARAALASGLGREIELG
jgi:ornithine cyclodeaminase/alanine dehydrogenase-like protein (mu-crystallin family)